MQAFSLTTIHLTLPECCPKLAFGLTCEGKIRFCEQTKKGLCCPVKVSVCECVWERFWLNPKRVIVKELNRKRIYVLLAKSSLAWLNSCHSVKITLLCLCSTEEQLLIDFMMNRKRSFLEIWTYTLQKHCHHEWIGASYTMPQFKKKIN